MSDAPVSNGPSAAPVNDAAQPVETSPAAPATEPTYSIKINGKVVDMSLSDLKRHASLSAAADEKFRKASEIEKSHKELTETLKGKKLVAALEKQGYSKAEIRDVLENELLPFYEEDQLSPQEKMLKERDAELKKYKDMEENEKLTKAEQQQQAEVDKAIAQLDFELSQAVKKHGLPVNPTLIKWGAQILDAYATKGVYLSSDEAMGMVKQQFVKTAQGIFGGSDAKLLKEMLGKDIIQKLRADDAQGVADNVKHLQKPKANPADAAKKPVSEEQNFDRESFLDKLRGIRK